MHYSKVNPAVADNVLNEATSRLESHLKKPDIPHGEEFRLKTLRSLNILDTLPEERFDRLTRMAKKLFDVPIALVSLVDENRQWFKSRQGLNASETPRDISFCGHAILGREIFLINDTLKDVRFKDNPLVLGKPNIRFYAGRPLLSQNGNTLGTLCIIDNKPRKFSDEDIDILNDLAKMVEREIAVVEMAIEDDLTKITNRRGFMVLSQHGINSSIRNNIPATLIFFDLNRFKLINDRFGHAEGDRAIKTFAEIMKSVFRQSDVYARIGGDEFAVFLNNTSTQEAELIAARFRKAIQKHYQQFKAGYELSFCCGIIELDHQKHHDIETWLAAGDALMYENKKRLNCNENQQQYSKQLLAD